MGATKGAGVAYQSGTQPTSGFYFIGVHVTHALVLHVVLVLFYLNIVYSECLLCHCLVYL